MEPVRKQHPVSYHFPGSVKYQQPVAKRAAGIPCKLIQMLHHHVECNQECNDRESISNRFCNSLQNRFPDNHVLNRNYFQFPNYIGIVEIYRNEENYIDHYFYFEICISLLCD